MGITPLALEFLQHHISRVGGFVGLKMMELGDQQMYCHPNIPEASAAKAYFRQIGVDHTSIDLNGELGAIPIDLSKPIETPDWQKAFGVVTDFGTSEHVGKSLRALYECRRNCHNFCCQNGLLLFMNPKAGNWPEHGYHYFTQEHYTRLAPACGCELLEVSEHPTLGNSVDGWQIHACLLKVDDAPFISFEEYWKICDGTVFPK